MNDSQYIVTNQFDQPCGLRNDLLIYNMHHGIVVFASRALANSAIRRTVDASDCKLRFSDFSVRTLIDAPAAYTSRKKAQVAA